MFKIVGQTGLLLVSVVFLSSLNATASTEEDAGAREARHQQFKEAIQACEASTGVTLPAPHSGVRPAKEDMEKIHACMKEKGFDFHHPKPQPAPEESK